MHFSDSQCLHVSVCYANVKNTHYVLGLLPAFDNATGWEPK